MSIMGFFATSTNTCLLEDSIASKLIIASIFIFSFMFFNLIFKTKDCEKELLKQQYSMKEMEKFRSQNEAFFFGGDAQVEWNIMHILMKLKGSTYSVIKS